jgi:hypothetical protein
MGRLAQSQVGIFSGIRKIEVGEKFPKQSVAGFLGLRRPSLL